MIILEDKIYKIETLKTRLINKITFKLFRTSGSTNILHEHSSGSTSMVSGSGRLGHHISYRKGIPRKTRLG